MIKEIDSQEYLNHILKDEKDEKIIIDKFIDLFLSDFFCSSDKYPEIFLLTYKNNHPFLNSKFKNKLTLDFAIQWMPFNDYRESNEEESNCIDQENFHCYQLHLYLYFDNEEERETTMICELQHLVNSYKEKEEIDKNHFLVAVKNILEELSKKGIKYLGYETDFTDAQ